MAELAPRKIREFEDAQADIKQLQDDLARSQRVIELLAKYIYTRRGCPDWCKCTMEPSCEKELIIRATSQINF